MYQPQFSARISLESKKTWAEHNSLDILNHYSTERKTNGFRRIFNLNIHVRNRKDPHKIAFPDPWLCFWSFLPLAKCLF